MSRSAWDVTAGGSLKSDPSRLEMYRCHNRLDLQQQHHKCKSYRRTLRCAEREGCLPRTDVLSSSITSRRRRRRRLVQSDPVWPPDAYRSDASRRPAPGSPRISRQLFWAAVLLLCAGFCTKTGCDDTEQFQKNSKGTSKDFHLHYRPQPPRTRGVPRCHTRENSETLGMRPPSSICSQLRVENLGKVCAPSNEAGSRSGAACSQLLGYSNKIHMVRGEWQRSGTRLT
uniref:Uncharacterized protein n=1 Tax=Anopheles farauti TaxID=69004 RepID=A0A182QJ80_9DIPT